MTRVEIAGQVFKWSAPAWAIGEADTRIINGRASEALRGVSWATTVQQGWEMFMAKVEYTQGRNGSLSEPDQALLDYLSTDNKVEACKLVLACPQFYVRRIMERNGWSRYELANQSGASPDDIKRLLEGEDVKVSTLHKVLRAEE